MSTLHSTPKRAESLRTKGLPMCHKRTHYQTATSGCGVRSHSSFRGSESPNPLRNSCSSPSINCFAFHQTNLGILLVRQAVPPLCSQHCAWNTRLRLMRPVSIRFQKSQHSSDPRCHLERLPNPRQDPQHRSPNHLVPVCANCPCLLRASPSGCSWGVLGLVSHQLTLFFWASVQACP